MADYVGGVNHLDLHLLGAGDGRIEIVNLEPQEHAVSVRLEIRIADRAMIVFHVPSMQLQHELPVRNKPFVFGAAVRALTTEQTLIPATAGLDIVHAN